MVRLRRLYLMEGDKIRVGKRRESAEGQRRNVTARRVCAPKDRLEKGR